MDLKQGNTKWKGKSREWEVKLVRYLLNMIRYLVIHLFTALPYNFLYIINELNLFSSEINHKIT